MTRHLRWLMPAAAVVCTTPARAQAPGGATVQSQVSATTVEVNQSFSFSFSVMTADSSPMPRTPMLAVPRGVIAKGPSVGTKQHVSLSGGRVETRRGITATWTLVATKPGTLNLGPPSADVGGRRINGPPRVVRVVDAGKLPRRQGPTTDPFDVFRGIPGFRLGPLFGTEEDETEDDFGYLPPFPDELETASAPDPIAFLRTVVEPRDAVVGEQVTLKIFAYGSRGVFREVNTSEPSRADFLSYPILDNSYGERLHRVPVDGTIWQAMKVREAALFPIKSGTLEIGAFKMGFSGRGYPGASRHNGLIRFSPTVGVRVTEPPADGRPAGYRIGDVGRFSLSARVDPRSVSAGEAASVVVKLEGSGNLPHRLEVPAKEGAEWLEPAIVEEVGPRGSTIGGWRKFTYVVRFPRPGKVDLGTLSLPFWDPSRESYDVAEARLGAVEVTPADGAPVAPEEQAEPLDSLGRPRRLGPSPERALRWTDHDAFWLLVAGGPFSVVLTSGGLRVARSIRRRYRSGRESHRALATAALREAKDRLTADDAPGAASAVERAVFHAIDDATGKKARALLRSELAHHLRDAGLRDATAAEAVAVLESCDAMRFGSDGESGEKPAAVVDAARRLVRKLGQSQKSG